MAQLCLVSKGVAKAAESRKQKENEAAFNMKPCRVLDHNTRQKETAQWSKEVFLSKICPFQKYSTLLGLTSYQILGTFGNVQRARKPKKKVGLLSEEGLISST